jgi:hypothetical protein
MCLTVGGKEKGRCNVIHRGIPYGGACPLGGGVHNIGGVQYL